MDAACRQAKRRPRRPRAAAARAGAFGASGSWRFVLGPPVVPVSKHETRTPRTEFMDLMRGLVPPAIGALLPFLFLFGRVPPLK